MLTELCLDEKWIRRVATSCLSETSCKFGSLAQNRLKLELSDTKRVRVAGTAGGFTC